MRKVVDKRVEGMIHARHLMFSGGTLMLPSLLLVRGKSFLHKIRAATLRAKFEFGIERALAVECTSPLLWTPGLMLLFASLKHDENCCLALILPHTFSDVVMLIPLCFQVTNHVDVVSEHEGLRKQ